MRKLAPVFITTSILALVAGNAAAMGDFKKNKKDPAANPTPATLPSNTTDTASPSPTVPSNSQNPQGMSHADKSNTSPGTNAKMDSNSSAQTASTAPMSPTTASTSNATERAGKSVDANTALANDDKQALSKQATSERSTIAAEDNATTSTHKAKKAKKKVAKNDNVSGNPPTSPTNGAASNSISGRSAGQ